MNTHICLLSGEIMPNIIGALHDRADLIVPVVTNASERLVEALTAALHAAGATATVGDPIPVAPFDLADCLGTLGRIARAHPGAAFNWTGGTKVMSFAARRVAEEARARAIYVFGNSRELLLEDLAAGTSRTDVTDATRLGLNVLVHLLAAGHAVEDAESIEQFHRRYAPAPELVDAATALFDATASERQDLNQLAYARDYRRPFRPRTLNPHFLRLLKQAGLIDTTGQPGEYFLDVSPHLVAFHRELPQQASARFLQATWLEVFLWSQIRRRSGFDQVGWSVRLDPYERGRLTELDIVVSGEGRLLVLEAKTSVDLKHLADLIEEQSSRCRRIGGGFARWMLYVHKFRTEHLGPEDASIIASAEARAQDYGGRLLWHDHLPELPVLLATFLSEQAPVL